MGLSHPISSKIVERRGDERFRITGVAMQGLRKSMEDSHVIVSLV